MSSFPLNIHPQQKLLITLTEAVSTTKWRDSGLSVTLRVGVLQDPALCCLGSFLRDRTATCSPLHLNLPCTCARGTPVARMLDGCWIVGAGRPLEKGRGAVWRARCQKLRVESPEGSLCLPSPPPAVLLPEGVLRAASESQPGGKRLILFDQNFSSLSFQGKHGSWRVTSVS